MGRRLWLVVVCAFWLVGCATPDRSISPSIRAALGGIDGFVLIPQSGLDVTVQPIDGGQGGFLGVLVAAAIDAKREESARKTAAPVLEALRGFDFRAEMLQALSAASAQQTRVPLRAPWRLETVDSDSHRRGLFDASNESAVLFLRTNYQMVSGNLRVLADVQVFPKTPALAGFRPEPKDGQPLAEGNAIYRKSFGYTRQNVTAETVAAALREGAGSVAAQLLADLARDQ